MTAAAALSAPALVLPPAPTLPVVLRAATRADWPFVFSSWLKSYEPTLVSLGVPSARYYDRQHATVERLLERGHCLLAEPEGTPGVYAGHLVYETRPDGLVLVHYVYVKQRFRRMGLARLLLSTVGAQGGRYTHHTRAGARLAELYGARFAPELLEAPHLEKRCASTESR